MAEFHQILGNGINLKKQREHKNISGSENSNYTNFKCRAHCGYLQIIILKYIKIIS